MDNIKELELSSPLRDGPQGYMATWYMAYLNLNRLIASPDMQGYTDPRIEMSVRHHITLITDDAKRQDAIDMLEEEIKRLVKLGDSNEERGRALFIACMNIEGAIAGWFDEFMGVSHKLTVGIATPPPDKEVVLNAQSEEADPVSG